MFYTGFIDVQ